MSPTILLILLFVVGLILLAAEMFLPAQGVLGVLGAAALLGAIGVGFWINQWLGLSLTVCVLAAAPFAVTAAINLWPKTAYGRRVVLSPEVSRIVVPRVMPGQSGLAMSEMRPAGEIEIDGSRLEARSEHGVIQAGRIVTVVGYIDGNVVVREADRAADRV